MASGASGSHDGCNQGGGNPKCKTVKNKRPVMQIEEEEETEEKSEIISLQQTGGKPDQKLVVQLTRALKSMTVKEVGKEIRVQRKTSTKKTIREHGRLATIPEETLARIEDHNLARRVACEWGDVPSEMSEAQSERKRLNTVRVYHDPGQQGEYTPIPMTMPVEVVPDNANTTEQ